MLDMICRDPIWELMDFFADPFARKITNKGLSNIGRPHNLTNVKNESGDIVAQKLTVVTTPFKKEDVKVKLLDDTLTVECGTENVKDEENEETVYRGISAQTYSFSLKLGENVDREAISAVNKDGMLTINIPLVQVEKSKPAEVEIKIA